MQPAKLDFWSSLQPWPGRYHLSQWPAKLELWLLSDPGGCDFALRTSKQDILGRLHPEARCELAERSSTLDPWEGHAALRGPEFT